MLTKNDLSQIKQVIEEVTDPKFQKLDKKIGNVEQKVDHLELKMDKEFKKVHKEIKTSVNFLDKDYLKVERRVTRIETVLQIPPASPI